MFRPHRPSFATGGPPPPVAKGGDGVFCVLPPDKRVRWPEGIDPFGWTSIERSGRVDFPMVTPDGQSTMLGQWRVALKQAEDAARAGRIDEALALATRPDVADSRTMVRLRDKLGLDLVARSARRAAADDLTGAIDDLRVAESLNVAPDILASARLALADQVADEIRANLDAGDPGRAVERIESLAKHKIGGPSLRRSREVAEAWRLALDEARRGEFARASEGLDRADRLAGETSRAALAAARRDVEARRKVASPAVDRLYAALAEGKWAETLLAAEAVIEVVPEHPAARQARARAWQQIAAISPGSARFPTLSGGRSVAVGFGAADAVPSQDAALSPQVAQPEPSSPRPATGLAGRFLLWVDAVGGYLVCLDDSVVLGRAGAESKADIPLLGDLSRRHAAVVRDADGSGYRIRAIQATFVNGKAVTEAPLVDGDVIRLGSNVEMEFRRPSPFSATARLRVVSRHRLPLAVDGMILMAETCIIGSNRQAHIAAPGLDGPVVLYRQGGGLCCRGPGNFEVDGHPSSGRASITTRSSVLGDGFSFSLEPLASDSTTQPT